MEDLQTAEDMLLQAQTASLDTDAYSYTTDAQSLVIKKACPKFRRANDMTGRLKCMEFILKAIELTPDTLSAKAFMQDELKMIERTGDKKATAQATYHLVGFYGTMGDNNEALAMTGSLITLQQELGDKAGEAKAYLYKAELKLRLTQSKPALDAAQQALKIYKELGNQADEDLSIRIINQAHCQSGHPEKAPGREKALELLEALKEALDERSHKDWQTAYENLMNNGAFTPKDVNDIPHKVINNTSERRATIKFLEVEGFDTTEYGGKSVERAKEVEKTLRYQMFRFGGLGYGPAFRLVQFANVVHRNEKLGNYVGTALHLTDAEMDWEKELAYQPGILDGMLQTAQALGLTQY